MPLSAQRRQQLDGIVNTMGTQNAPQADVQAVVSDFTNKYGNETAAPVPSQAPQQGQVKGASVQRQLPHSALGDFADSANNAFLGGIARKIAGGVKLFTNDATDQKIDQFVNRGAPMPDTSTGAGKAGSMFGGAEKLAAETVPTLLVGGPEGASLKAVLGRAGTNAALAAGNAVADSGASGNGSGQQIGDGLKAALAGGLFSAGGDLAGNGVKKALGGAAESTYNRLFKTPVNQRQAGQELIGTGIMKRGLVGDESQIAAKLGQRSDQAAQAVKDIIDKQGANPVDISPVRQALMKLEDRVGSTPGENVGAITPVTEAFGGNGPMSLASAQEMKQNLQHAVNNAFLNQNVSGTTEAQKVAAQQLRQAIEKAAPGVAEPNAEQSFAIRAINQLNRQGGASPSKLRMFAEIIAGGQGLATGDPVLPALVGAERLASNPKIATRAAQSAYQFSQKQTNPLTSRLLSVLAGRAAGGN